MMLKSIKEAQYKLPETKQVMPSFVSHEAIQAARRSAKRKRAAKACTSCKEKKAKCSGFSPCTRCINPADCVFPSNRNQLHHKTGAVDDMSKAPNQQTMDATALHSFEQRSSPLGQFASTASTVSLVPRQIGTPWTSGSSRGSHSHLQDPTQSSVPIQPLLKCTSDSVQNVAPDQAAFTQSIWQPQRVGGLSGISHPPSTYTLHCGRSRTSDIPQQQATGGSQSETGREAGISDTTLGMCENTNHGSSIGGWTCPPRAWLEGGDP